MKINLLVFHLREKLEIPSVDFEPMNFKFGDTIDDVTTFTSQVTEYTKILGR